VGNFQYLAEQVLIRNKTKIEKVSSFHSLAKETGNFQEDKGNITRNLNKTNIDESQCEHGFHMETGHETQRKPPAIIEETFEPENTIKSFLSGTNAFAIVNGFIAGADLCGIKLLHDDKRWLKTICFGVQSFRLKMLLGKYIDDWIAAMAQEPIQYKKQNVGRFAANTFIREALKK